MLDDKELSQAQNQLQRFTLEHETYLKTHNEVLDKYSQLMEEYKRLKSDYEEERDSREKYKQMARGQERNPFVLILIDGDGYVFDDDFIGSGGEGGSRAAQLLNDTVQRSLRGRGLEHCRIMVRIYANLAGLSKALSRTKLCGAEKRSLAPFVANFNRTNELFDFVDAGELKENADFKIRAMFRQFVDNPQCRHIFFAACHDVGYISELTPHINRDRISLVRTYAFHPAFAKLGLRAEDFLNIFRTGPLPTDGLTPYYPKPAAPIQPSYQSNQHSTPSAEDNSGNICTFYQRGLCRYGKGCKFAHVKTSNSNGFKDAIPNKPPSPFHMPHISKNDNDFMSGRTDPIEAQIDFVTLLPHEEVIPPSKVPINKNHQRLDAYIPPATSQERAAFASRVELRKLCNNFHLNSFCASGDACPYDHSSVTPGMVNCLKSAARGTPCPRRGGCRSLTCCFGHICQRAECKYRGGKTHCKLPPYVHTIDLNVAEFVPGTNNAKDFIGDENGSLNGKAVSLSPPAASDSGEETQEGADLGESIVDGSVD